MLMSKAGGGGSKKCQEVILFKLKCTSLFHFCGYVFAHVLFLSVSLGATAQEKHCFCHCEFVCILNLTLTLCILNLTLTINTNLHMF